MTKIAVLRIRGLVKTRGDLESTLEKIKLTQVNRCSIIDDTPSYLGMLQNAKDVITWGELKPETFKKMLLKWGRVEGDNRLDAKFDVDGFAKEFFAGKKKLADAGVKPYFRLHPPRSGFKSVKFQYPRGDLGNRGEKINDLLERMI